MYDDQYACSGPLNLSTCCDKNDRDNAALGGGPNHSAAPGGTGRWHEECWEHNKRAELQHTRVRRATACDDSIDHATHASIALMLAGPLAQHSGLLDPIRLPFRLWHRKAARQK